MRRLAFFIILYFAAFQPVLAGNHRDVLMIKTETHFNTENESKALGLLLNIVNNDNSLSLVFATQVYKCVLKHGLGENKNRISLAEDNGFSCETDINYDSDSQEKIVENIPDDSIGLRRSERYYLVGDSFYHVGVYDSAKSYYDKALDLALQYNDTTKIISIYLHKGIICKVQGDYTCGMRYYIKALECAEKSNDTLNISTIYNSIGLIYKNQNLYDKALSYFFESLELNKALNNRDIQSKVYGNIGIVYRRIGEYDKALHYLNNSLSFSKSIGNKDYMSSAFTNIADVYKEKGNYRKAIESYNKSLEIKKEIGDQEGIAIVYQGIGSLYLALSASPGLDTKSHSRYLQKSILFSEKSYTLSRKLNILPIQKEALETLFTAYAKIGDFAKAYKYSKKYISVKDSLIRTGKLDVFNELEKKHIKEKSKLLIEKLEKEIELEAEKAERQELDLLIQKRQKYLLIIGMLILLIITLLISRGLYKRKKYEFELRSSKEKIEEVVRQFEETIENLEDIYFMTDKDFFFQQLSPSVIKHLGLKDMSQIIGMHATEFLCISKAERFRFILKFRRKNSIKDYLIEYKTLSGERKFGRVNARLLFKNGAFNGMEGIMRDVTKQVKNEELLRKLNDRLNKYYLESVKQNIEIATKNKEIERQVKIIADKNRQFKNAINKLEDVYFRTDRNMIYKFVSPSIIRHLDLEGFHQILEKPLMAYWDISEKESKSLLFHLLKKGIVSNLPIRYITRNGQKRYATVNASSIFIDGIFQGVEGIIRDITDIYLNNKKIQNLNLQKKVLLDNIPSHIFYKDLELRYVEVNSSFASLIGVPADILIGKTDKDVLPYDLAVEYEDMDMQIIETKKPIYDTVKYRKDKDGNNQWISTTKIPLIEKNGAVTGIIGVVRDITSQMEYEENLLKSKERIEEAHKKMLDNINYAKTIQEALLTSEQMLEQCFFDSFVLYKPKDQVSGDFYYIKKIRNHLVFAAADCTGHGVSGAFLTMLGITYLHDISNLVHINNPGIALDALREKVKSTFKSFGSDNPNGLDIALCALNLETYELEYAGAYNPLFIVRNGELIEIRATRNPIGYYPKEVPFESHIIQLQKGDTIYIFSDGFIDQMGGKKGKRYKIRQFKELIVKISNSPISSQKGLLEKELARWKGNYDQTDDIVIIGMKV